MKNKIILILYFMIICVGLLATTVTAEQLILNRFYNQTNHSVNIHITNKDFEYNKTVPANTNQTFDWASIVLADQGVLSHHDGGNGVITIDGVQYNYSWLKHEHFFDIVINGIGTLRDIGIYPAQGRAWMAMELNSKDQISLSKGA